MMNDHCLDYGNFNVREKKTNNNKANRVPGWDLNKYSIIYNYKALFSLHKTCRECK